MFSFFKKKSPPAPAPAETRPDETALLPAAPLTTDSPAAEPHPPAPVEAPPDETPAPEPLAGTPPEPEPAPQIQADEPPPPPPAPAPAPTSGGVFSFFRKKAPVAQPAQPPLATPAPAESAPEETVAAATPAEPDATAPKDPVLAAPELPTPAVKDPEPTVQPTAKAPLVVPPEAPPVSRTLPPASPPAPVVSTPPKAEQTPTPTPTAVPAPGRPPAPATPPTAPAKAVSPPVSVAPAMAKPEPVEINKSQIIAPTTPAPAAEAPPAARKGWLDRLKAGLRKTGASIAGVFTGTQIDDALYEELEEALLMADTGVKATELLLIDLKKRVKEAKATDPAAVKGLLADAITAMLKPLEKGLVIGEHKPTVIMVAGVNGAGKTTSIGKLTRHLANEGASVLLAAADTFRAAAREQLAVWADRNTVEIVTQEGGDPAAVSFDAVTAGRARGRDVVLVDTAGRLPTQLHLMEELRKIKRVVQKADPTGPHEVLLVIDGNTGQNALAQVKAFDETLGLTGLVITKLDGTAKGGVICAIARERPVPIYFIGVGEKLEDLETFNAREFAQALLA